ncbi:MAG TPA: sigma-70 family RNA polymerase sigma factor [Acidimicrobiales bacterium]|jgi:RNA polymerase sigma-70 factor (ECF subfamily)
MLGERFAVALKDAQGGDQAAFALLFRDLQPAVVRYLRVVATAAAEDLAAETWLEVVRGFRRFSGDEAGFRSWVLTIARRRHIDRLRALSRRAPEVTYVESLETVGRIDDAAIAVEENLSTEATLRLIATLPPAQAEVVTLRVVAGLSATAVAEIVGRRPGSVRILAHRGLRRLAEHVTARPGAVEA